MYRVSKATGFSLGCAGSLATWLCVIATTAADDDIRTVTISGRPLPGFGTDQVNHTTTFGDAVLNNLGEVAYLGQLTGPGVEPKNRDSYWRYTPNQGLELLARSSDPAPGRPGQVFQLVLGPVKISDAGHVELLSHLANANEVGVRTQHLGTWVWTPNGIVKLTFINERTPQIAHYFQPTGSLTNELDQQIRGAVVQPSNGILPHNQSLWFLDPNAEPQLIAKVGDAAPGLASGITLSTEFSGFFWGSDRTIFRMGLAGAGVNATNNFGYWLGDASGSNLQLIIRNGSQAPGLPAGIAVDFSTIPFVRRPGNGELEFRWLLSGPGINSSNNVAIWTYGSTGLELRAREGDQAPGLANGVVFEQLSSPTRVVGPGIDTSNDTGIWLLQKDGFKLGVREGDRAPGTADSVVFSTREVGFETLVFSGTGVVQNKSEQFAFMGYLSGPGVTDANDVGLWASHRDGELQLIAREGQELDIDDGPGVDMRTIGSISTRTFDATGQFLNDRGQVLFWATFTDGSKGLFLSDLVAVPEPCCFTLVATLAAVALRARESRRRLISVCQRGAHVRQECLSPRALLRRR